MTLQELPGLQCQLGMLSPPALWTVLSLSSMQCRWPLLHELVPTVQAWILTNLPLECLYLCSCKEPYLMQYLLLFSLCAHVCVVCFCMCVGCQVGSLVKLKPNNPASLAS